jgi:hypothetical protein
MRCANCRERGQAPQKGPPEGPPRPGRALQLDGEAVSEQEREQQVELGLRERRDGERGRAIGRAGEVRILEPAAVPGGGEVADVHEQDPGQREAAQSVEQLHARRPGDRDGGCGAGHEAR